MELAAQPPPGGRSLRLFLQRKQKGARGGFPDEMAAVGGDVDCHVVFLADGGLDGGDAL